MHCLCYLIGHKWTKRIENKSIIFADHLYCGRCEKWNNEMPMVWIWGNGLFVDVWTGIKSFVMYKIIYPIDRWKHRNDELPF